MSELEILLWLTQAPHTLLEISRNIGATMTASRKLAHEKVFLIFFTKRNLFYIKNALQSINVIALNFYIDTNELVYESRLMMKVFSMTKVLC